MAKGGFTWKEHRAYLRSLPLAPNYLILLKKVQNRFAASRDRSVAGRVSTYHLLLDFSVPQGVARIIVGIYESDVQEALWHFLFPDCIVTLTPEEEAWIQEIERQQQGLKIYLEDDLVSHEV